MKDFIKDCINLDTGLDQDDVIAVVAKALRETPHYILPRRQRRPYWKVITESAVWSRFRRQMLEGNSWMLPKVGYLFTHASSRTLGSLMEAALLASFSNSFPYTGETSSLKKGEPPGRTAITMLEQRNELLCYRTDDIEGTPQAFARFIQRNANNYPAWFSQAPIINGGDGRQNHPTQVLLDLATIVAYALGVKICNEYYIQLLAQRLNRMNNRELEEFIKGTLNGLKIAFVGDLYNSRVLNSWLHLAKKFEIEIVLISPSSFRVEQWRLEGLKVAPKQYGNLQAALDQKVDIVYTLRFKHEYLKTIPGMTLDEAESMVEELRIKTGFYHKFVNSEQEDESRPRFKVFMDAQPLDRERPIIVPELWSGHPNVIMDFQALMGIPTRVAVFLLTWAGRKEQRIIPVAPEITPLELLVESIPEHQRKNREKWLHNQRSVNPLDNGMVFDRILAGLARKIDELLERAGVFGDGGSTATIAQRKRSEALGQKDILFLEDVFVTFDIISVLMILAPEMKVVELKNGMYRKLQFEVSRLIEFLLNCPNSQCVTNVDPEADTLIHVRGSGDEMSFHCEDCGHRFSRKQIITAI